MKVRLDIVKMIGSPTLKIFLLKILAQYLKIGIAQHAFVVEC